jgi:iron complex outermembrane receptor protein
MLSSSMRRTLLASTIIAGSLVSSIAGAQTNSQATNANPTADAAAAADEGQTIVVTGSLLTNPNLAQAAPVNVTTAEEITLRQNNVAEEVLRDIPGIVPNVGSAVNNGNGGASFVDLRGLGSFRNLVLLDGQRIAPSGLAGRVDLNNIPLALVERVDALTGGASTTYGADAVSGVVNFITRKDFSGVEVSLGEQITQRGDGNYLRADVTLGANFDDGRGNAVFSIGYQESDPVYQGDRDFSYDSINSSAGIYSGSGTAVPSRFSGTRPLIAGTNTPNTDPTVANGGVRQINAAGQAVTNFAAFNFNPYNIFQTPFKRFNMYGQANYQASDAIEVYTRGLFSKNNVKTIIAPSGSFGAAVSINLNNPFLPATLRNQLCAFNVGAAGTYVPRFDQATCDAAALATGPSDPRYRVIGSAAGSLTTPASGANVNPLNPPVTLARRATEAGPRISDYTTTIFDYRAGLRGAITDTINWDVSGAYGESENRQRIQGYTLNSRFRQALLVNGTAANPVCQDTSNGCVPANVFGPEGSITPAAVGFLVAESTTFVKTSLAQARAIISGDVGFNSPFANDSINFALGGEYRRYTAQQRADALAKSGDLGGAGGASPDIDGGYDVYEAIGELAIPLVQDKPFFNSLSVNAGVRYSHYTVATPTQPKFNTTTWKVEGVWEPVRDLKFRGGYARAVRAPNIAELFSPQNTVLTSLSTDPCAGNAPVNNANLRAVCIAQGATAAQIGSITNPTAGQANITTGGNLNLKPEKSNSYTFGAVIQPSFFSGFSATIDYYNIKIRDAITTPTPGDIIAACFNNLSAASATNPACTSIRRNQLTGTLDGDPSISKGLFGALTNQGELKTDGIDVSLSYRTPLAFAGDDVKLALSFTGNYTFNSKFKANQADPASYDRDCTGFYSANCASIQPKFQWSQRTTVTFGDIDVSLLWRHIDKVAYEGTASDYVARGFNCGTAAAPTPCLLFKGTLPAGGSGLVAGRTVDFNRIKAYDYFDLAFRFGLTKNVDLTMSVQNLLDKDPPLVGSTAGSTGFNSGNTYPSTYDAQGRKFAVGAKLKF